MKRLSTLVLVGALTVAGSAAATGSISSNEIKPDVMPVLVQVNSHGKVTRVSPSTQLSPRYQRLLRDNIEQLVIGPARSRNGAVSSQFVMNVTLKSTPRPDGRYDSHFAYISARPVPFGPMHWVNIDGRRLELARDGDMFRRQDHPNYGRPYRQVNRPDYQRPAPMPSNPSVPSTPPNARGTSQGR